MRTTTESDPFKEEIDSEDTACWVWQFADSAEEAKDQHIQKMDDYQANPDKETY